MALIAQPQWNQTGASVGLYMDVAAEANKAPSSITVWGDSVAWKSPQAPSASRTLYVPFSIIGQSIVLKAKTLHDVFGPQSPTPAPIFTGYGDAPPSPATLEDITLYDGGTVFVPYVPETTSFEWFTKSWKKVMVDDVAAPTTTGGPESSSTSEPSSIPASYSTSASSSSGHGPTTSDTGPTPAAAEGQGSGHCNCTLDTSSPNFWGRLAGGVIGGVLLGMMICFLTWFCCRRRPKNKSSIHHNDSPTAAEPHYSSKHATFAKESQFAVVPKGVVDWQKHLPQEKDDAAIVRSIETIYDQVQIHIEGFYRAKAGKLTSQDIALLGRYCSDSFSDDLRDLPSALPLLEAIFIRWIVHRISLRSSTRQSFLPSEYTKVPKQNGWHMETDDNDQGHAAESAKGQY